MEDFNRNSNGENHYERNDGNAKTYYYTVSGEPEEKIKSKRGKRTAALAILIVVCVIMSSVATSLMTSYFYKNSGKGDYAGTGTGSTNNGQPSGNQPSTGVNDTIIINKNETDKENQIGGSIGDENMSVVQVTHLVADSVVEITTSSVKYNVYYGQYVESGAGSGVIIGRSDTNSKIYYVVTNHHVVNDAEKIYLTLRDGTELEGTFISSDVISDIALVQIESEAELTVAKLGNGKNVLVGEDVVVIGNPLGQLGGTVTNGIISALEREVTVDGLKMKLMQTNAAISPGNSGGGMFNMSGELIGIINAKSTDESAEGLGFAIPIDYAYEIISDLLTRGYVSGRAALPVDFQEYTYTVSIMGQTSTYLVISGVEEGSSLKLNDIIYSIDDHQITTQNSLLAVLSNYKVGDTVELSVARTSGRTQKLYTYSVKLVESVPSAVSE